MSSLQLELHLLGVARVCVGDENLKLTRKALALLAYIAIEGVTPRELMAELLWGELGAEGASRNLRRELHRLRATSVVDYLETDGALALQNFVADTSDPLVSGELLAGLILEDAPAFTEWLVLQRQQRLQSRVQLLRVAALETPNLEVRLAGQREVVLLEPLSESDARDLIQTLMLLGRAEEAEQVYAELLLRLQEVGAKPSLLVAQDLIPSSASAESKALLLERLGHGSDSLEFRLNAAQEARSNLQPDVALEHYAVALAFQTKPSQRFVLHFERLQLLFVTAQFAQLPVELAALEQSVQGDAVLEARALVVKASVFFQQTLFSEALVNAKLALENPLLPKTDRGNAYFYAGVSSIRLGQLEPVSAWFERALEFLPENASAERAQIHHAFSQFAMQRGQIPEARQHNQIAADLLEHSEDRRLRSGVLSVSGVLAMMIGEYAKALRLLEVAKREALQSQNTVALPMILINLSKAQIELGELSAGIESLEEALVLVRSNGNKAMEGQLLNNLAITHFERGNLGVALETFTAGLEFAEQNNDARAMIWRRISIADLLMQIGAYQEATQYLEQASSMVQQNAPELQDWCALQHAEVALGMGQTSQTLRLLKPLLQAQDAELRLNAKHLTALALEQQQQTIDPELLLEHQAHPKWKYKILPLRLRLESKNELQTLAREGLLKAAAFDRLALLVALSENSTELQTQLLSSLELYPNLQALLQLRLQKVIALA